MVVAGRTVPRVRVPSALLSLADLEPRAPALATAAVLAGLVVMVFANPIGSGDYGQWLMTSRYFLGEDVPDYRVLSAVPPVVPMVLAVIRMLGSDPLPAVLVLDGLLLVSLGAGWYLNGALVGSRWVGPFAVVIGFLVTDRFTELLAFGGLLQLGSLAFTALGVVAFTLAGRGSRIERRWWIAGSVLLALTGLSHVGTGVIGVPGVGLAALMALARHRDGGWVTLRWPVTVMAAAAGITAVYWLVVLLPGSAAYATNPASAAYRGPDHLFDTLFGHWPTTLVLVSGTAAVLLGVLRSIALRRLDGYVPLAAWAGVAWLSLAVSLLTGAATDYPRFATPLLAPLVVGSAVAGVWVLDRLVEYLRGLDVPVAPAGVASVSLAVALVIAVPATSGGYASQARFYELRDVAAFQQAVAWMDGQLGSKASVLAGTREAKWVEGLTGRTALFSQPVRYAFRPVEWQRSVEADALLRSTATLTSGLVMAQFTNVQLADNGIVPGGPLLVSANHDGELITLLEVSPQTGGLLPVDARSALAPNQVTLTTRWRQDGQDAPTYSQSVTAWRNGSALRVSTHAAQQPVAMTVRPVSGMAFTSLAVEGRGAVACFTQIGAREPCLRIQVSPEVATLVTTTDGSLAITAAPGTRVDLFVTALTAGENSVELNLLEPAEVASAHDLGAALLYASDPAYPARLGRLEAIGFRVTYSAGPYRVLLRADGPPVAAP